MTQFELIVDTIAYVADSRYTLSRLSPSQVRHAPGCAPGGLGAEVGDQRSEVRGRMGRQSEIGGRRSEVGGQGAEALRADHGIAKAETDTGTLGREVVDS